jgi:hypothetical protein
VARDIPGWVLNAQPLAKRVTDELAADVRAAAGIGRRLPVAALALVRAAFGGSAGCLPALVRGRPPGTPSVNRGLPDDATWTSAGATLWEPRMYSAREAEASQDLLGTARVRELCAAAPVEGGALRYTTFLHLCPICHLCWTAAPPP